MPSAESPSLRSSLLFKVATETWEMEAIHRLNHQTFVEEIPQHRPREEGRLVDQFHEENTYLICLRGEELVGMVAVRDQRPFSLEKKLPALESYLPPHQSICEVRLLSVAPSVRRTSVVAGLMSLLADHVQLQGYDLGIISGTVRQLKLYKHIGFVPFGPTVGTDEALYQPMYMTAESLMRFRANSRALTRSPSAGMSVNLLPGPCTLSTRVRKALGSQPVSHRSATFCKRFDALRARLCQLVHARRVYILSGAGTLANDAIAAQLSGRGLILVNGEFGRRLVDHASRAGLAFDVYEVPDGQAFNYEKIPAGVDWIWMVHLETSTGVLNRPGRIAHPKLILDCVSSIGVTPVDLSRVYLASGVSGKGLNSAPGLALVFSGEDLAGQNAPRALDLVRYDQAEGIPCTISSNLVFALEAALQELDLEQRLRKIADISHRLQDQLNRPALAESAEGCPAVITLQLSDGQNSRSVGEALEKQQIFVSYRSAYLQQANRIQLCLMSKGEVPVDHVAKVINKLLADR